MAINKNHEFEELDGVKCAVVEKNISAARVEFLKQILEYNHYTVVVVPSPPAKTAPVAKAEEAATAETAVSAAPETFTLGVTDYTFNSVNAVYGRLLKAPNGHFVTPAYWQQKEAESDDSVPYYEKRF